MTRAAKAVQLVHTCHWPGCTRQVPPARWGCPHHWFTLPKDLRDRIWAAYVPGQEITKTPSDAYLEVAREAERYAREHEIQRRRAAAEPLQTSLF
jgi:hypothetical protein